MTDQHLEPDLIDMIEELTRHHSHRANYRREHKGTSWTQGHVTTVPPLVTQLLGVTTNTTGSGNDARSFRSKPAARIEALDTVMIIDQEAGDWVDRLGGVIPADRFHPGTTLPIPGSGTVRCIARLHSLMPAMADRCRRDKAHKHTERCKDRHDALTGTWCCTWHQIEHDVRRWWRQARIVTGWDSEPYRPWNTCPVCDHRGGLRINLVLQSGMCIECRTTWSPDDYRDLAAHIREENAEEATA